MSAHVSPRPRVGIVAWDVQEADHPAGIFADVIRAGRDEFDFVVVSAGLAPSLRPLVEWRRVPAAGRPLRLRWASFFVTGSARLLTTRTDLVHVSGGMPLVANRTDLVWMHLCHASLQEHLEQAGKKSSAAERLARSAVVRLERWCCRRTRLLVSPSDAILDDLARHFPAVPAVFVPVAIDTERFSPDDAARADLRTSLGVAPDDVVVVFVARDWELKGLDLAIEAVGRASTATGVPLRLWVLGDGIGRNRREAARDAADRFALAGRVLLAGNRPDVERYYQAGDLFLLPTISETYCRAAHEAAACELPVIATAVGGLRSLVGDDEAGVLVPRDAAVIADALARLVRDPARRAALGREGRKRVIGATRASAAASVLALYRGLLGGD